MKENKSIRDRMISRGTGETESEEPTFKANIIQ